MCTVWKLGCWGWRAAKRSRWAGRATRMRLGGNLVLETEERNLFSKVYLGRDAHDGAWTSFAHVIH